MINPDKFWSAIKKLFPTKLTSEQGSALQINGTKTTDKKSIAESFCDYFTNVAIKLKKKSFLLRDLVWSNPNGMTLPQVKEKFLFRSVKNLKRKKATGLDNLPPGLLKDAAGVIAKPFTFIIKIPLKLELSLLNGKWPR